MSLDKSAKSCSWKTVLSILVFFIVLLIITNAGNMGSFINHEPVRDEKPLKGVGLERSGRLLLYNGQIAYIVGLDLQELAADPSIDAAGVLDQLQHFGFNKVRVWIYCYWHKQYLHPWVYSTASKKFDLDTWNPIFWNRLRSVVSAAQQRNIIVEVSIFGPNNIRPAANWSNPEWQTAWNRSFNINQAFTQNAKGDFFPEFFDLGYSEKSHSGRTIKDYQQALIDKTIAEIGLFDNVYFEVANEFPVVFDSRRSAIDRLYNWQLHWAQYIKQKTTRLISCHSHQGSGAHTLGVEHFSDQPYIDVLNFHFYETSPSNISILLHGLQDKQKVLTENESFHAFQDLDKVTREAWGWLMSGGYYGFYISTEEIGSRKWISLGQRGSALRHFAEMAQFWKLSPIDGAGREYDSIILQGPAGVNWQVLAKPGERYAAYFWGQQSGQGVLIRLPRAKYEFQWYDPRDGRCVLTGQVAGASATKIQAPAVTDWQASVGLGLIIYKTSP